jgi:hypothetical protein
LFYSTTIGWHSACAASLVAKYNYGDYEKIELKMNEFEYVVTLLIWYNSNKPLIKWEKNFNKLIGKKDSKVERLF